jgi:uncharacterized protein
MTIQPSTSKHRIESIDILRGIALFGIALVHMVEQYYAGPLPEDIGKALTPSIADRIADGFVGVFIIGKFYMIFSFLFGLSFFIQLSKKNDESFLIRFAWRLVILFALGMLHHLHYRGDILTIYAMLGFGLLLCYRLPDKPLLIISLILIFNIPSLFIRVIGLFLPGEGNPFNFTQESLMLYYQTIKTGTYLDIMQANYYSFAQKMDFQVNSGRIYITFGLFLLGMYAGRKGLFERVNEYIPFLRKMIRYALYTIGLVIVVAVGLFGTLGMAGVKITEELGWLIGGLAFDTFNCALAAIYVSWILLLLQKEKWQNRLMVFFPVGRMGLTTYLMQSAAGTLIFFNTGLALAYELGSFYSLLLGFSIFILQMVFASLWFRYFEYGPVEWIWRTLTYFRVFSIVRNKRNAIEAEPTVIS